METERITAECWVLIALNGGIGLILGVAVAALFRTFLSKD